MHLAADPARHPAGMPTRLGGVDGGNQWHVEVFGERDGRVGHQPVVGVHDVGPPGSVGARVFSASPARTIAWPMASVQAIMSVPKLELVRVLGGGDHPHALADLVGRRVGAGVGARWAAG